MEGGPNLLAALDRGVQIRRGSKAAVTPELENGNDRQNFKKAADNAFNLFFDCVACTSLACVL